MMLKVELRIIYGRENHSSGREAETREGYTWGRP